MKEFHSRLKNLCGVATLCAGAIFSLLSVAFMGIAFATNNWVHISVNRNELLQSIEAENDTKAIEEFQKGNINSIFLFLSFVYFFLHKIKSVSSIYT